MSEKRHALERVATLEEERDALRVRLASFERGEPDAAYRAELTRLEEQFEKLRSENEELRRRIAAARSRRVINFGAFWSLVEDAARDLWELVVRR
jgi:phage shock protein A